MPQNGQCVETSVADVGFGVRVGRFGFLRRPMRTALTVVFPRVRRRVQTRRRRRREQPGRLRVPIWRSWNYQENAFNFISFLCLGYLIADMDNDHVPRLLIRICRNLLKKILHTSMNTRDSSMNTGTLRCLLSM